MMLEKLSDADLHQANIKVARNEREAAALMIMHLVETNKRHLYSKFARSSLYEYCMKDLKMSKGDAWRKSNAASIVEEQPDLEPKIASGELTPTNLAEAVALFNREGTSETERKEIIAELENKTTEEAKDILLGRSKKPEQIFRERKKRKTKDITEVTLYLDNETMEALQRLKEIFSHAIPKGELSKIVKRIAKEAREKHEPLNKKAPAPGTKARIKYEVMIRDEGQCTYRDPQSNERCASKHFIEDDHIVPEAMGGEYTVENIRLRCRTHNQRHAINTYGITKMRNFIRTPAVPYINEPPPPARRSA